MKRSEMIGIIADFLWQSNGIYALHRHANEDASNLLTLLESNGMTPPVKDKSVVVKQENGELFLPIWGWDNE